MTFFIYLHTLPQPHSLSHVAALTGPDGGEARPWVIHEPLCWHVRCEAGLYLAHARGETERREARWRVLRAIRDRVWRGAGGFSGHERHDSCVIGDRTR